MTDKDNNLIDEDGNPITECYCDPCGDRECGCWYKRCDWCVSQW